ncbi:MAG: T9SS type A sorting domain-containing protein [Bacteroidales bacterium]
MKRTIYLLAFVLVSHIAISQTSCISCNNNTIDTANHSSAVGSENLSTGLNSFAAGSLNEATGENSVALVKSANAFGDRSVAIGSNAIAGGNASLALGFWTETLDDALASIALGSKVTAAEERSIIIGVGMPENPIINNISNSLLIGFNSNLPTFFVGPANGVGTMGKVGIGTTTPSQLLEVNGNMKVIDYTFLNHLIAENIIVNSSLNLNSHQISGITTLKGVGELKLQSISGGDADVTINTEGNVGIANDNPIARLQVNNGDIFIEDINRGIIMKSPDGNCWRGTLDNNGSLQFAQVDCDNLTTGSAEQEVEIDFKVKIYPNPVGDKVFVSVSDNYIGFKIEIADIQGKVVYSDILSNSEVYIDLAQFSSGMYVLNVKDNSGRLVNSEKVMKK